jgi:hypothetical protein
MDRQEGPETLAPRSCYGSAGRLPPRPAAAEHPVAPRRSQAGVSALRLDHVHWHARVHQLGGVSLGYTTHEAAFLSAQRGPDSPAANSHSVESSFDDGTVASGRWHYPPDCWHSLAWHLRAPLCAEAEAGHWHSGPPRCRISLVRFGPCFMPTRLDSEPPRYCSLVLARRGAEILLLRP